MRSSHKNQVILFACAISLSFMTTSCDSKPNARPGTQTGSLVKQTDKSASAKDDSVKANSSAHEQECGCEEKEAHLRKGTHCESKEGCDCPKCENKKGIAHQHATNNSASEEGCACNHNPKDHSHAHEKHIKDTKNWSHLTVEGMTCGGCAQRVHNALTANENIDAAKVDHESGAVSFHVRANPKDATVFAEKAIARLGYRIKAGSD